MNVPILMAEVKGKRFGVFILTNSKVMVHKLIHLFDEKCLKQNRKSGRHPGKKGF